MTIASAELLRSGVTLKRQEVPLPEFGDGVSVYVRQLTAKEWSEFRMSMLNSKFEKDKDKLGELKERYIIFCMVDEAGQPIFSLDDLETVKQWPAIVVNRLNDAADALNDGDLDSKSLGNGSETTGGDS